MDQQQFMRELEKAYCEDAERLLPLLVFIYCVGMGFIFAAIYIKAHFGVLFVLD